VPAEVLAGILADLPLPEHPNLLAATKNGEDAAVYRINDEQAVIATVDFFTPIVDDAYDYGRIAAMNAISDIYAMGGTPFLALNVVAFPQGSLDDVILKDMLRGGADTCVQEGVLLAGGHTVKSPDILYGLATLGLVAPDRIVTNEGAVPGDALVLTKALGTGVIQTAVKAGDAPAEAAAAARDSMLKSNREAAAAMAKAGAVCATDITGFGFLGHGLEVARASGVGIRVFASRLPFIPGAFDLADTYIPGGLTKNLKFAEPHITVGDGVNFATVNLLADPQTSGGLLVALPADRAQAYAEEVGAPAAVVAEVFESPEAIIEVVE
jgi:selenide,water dikinase